jgi:hypothetical protein
MAWKIRGNNSYYYVSERNGSRVESSYLGRGEAARLIAALNEGRRAERQAEREAERATIEKMRAEDAAFDQVDALVMELTNAHLIEAGFHQVKRVWRKKRCKQ